jgi:hypothetical protein
LKFVCVVGNKKRKGTEYHVDINRGSVHTSQLQWVVLPPRHTHTAHTLSDSRVVVHRASVIVVEAVEVVRRPSERRSHHEVVVDRVLLRNHPLGPTIRADRLIRQPYPRLAVPAVEVAVISLCVTVSAREICRGVGGGGGGGGVDRVNMCVNGLNCALSLSAWRMGACAQCVYVVCFHACQAPSQVKHRVEYKVVSERHAR